jgi:hypothetical protein
MEEGGRGKRPAQPVSTLCLRCRPRTPNSRQSAPGAAPSPTAVGRLNCLASSPNGCSEAIMLARGFTVEQMAELVHAGLATTNAERVAMSARAIEVARVRITEAGRSALSER